MVPNSLEASCLTCPLSMPILSLCAEFHSCRQQEVEADRLSQVL